MDMAINIMAAFEQETPAPTYIFPGFFPVFSQKSSAR